MSIFNIATKSAHSEIQLKPKFETNAFNDRLRARDFVWQYAKTFCVYCPITYNLYADYDFFNIDGDRNVIVLPKSDQSSTFASVEETTIHPTPIMLIPNGKLSRAHIVNRRKKNQSLPASDSLLKLTNNNCLMPVILKSNLKRLKSDTPFLMLHTINLRALENHSVFNQNQIRSAIIEKLEGAAEQWRG